MARADESEVSRATKRVTIEVGGCGRQAKKTRRRFLGAETCSLRRRRRRRDKQPTPIELRNDERRSAADEPGGRIEAAAAIIRGERASPRRVGSDSWRQVRGETRRQPTSGAFKHASARTIEFSARVFGLPPAAGRDAESKKRVAARQQASLVVRRRPYDGCRRRLADSAYCNRANDSRVVANFA